MIFVEFVFHAFDRPINYFFFSVIGERVVVS